MKRNILETSKQIQNRASIIMIGIYWLPCFQTIPIAPMAPKANYIINTLLEVESKLNKEENTKTLIVSMQPL